MRQIYRPRDIDTQQIVLGIRNRRGDRADITAIKTDASHDGGQIKLALTVIIGQILPTVLRRGGPDGIQRAVAFGRVQQFLANGRLRNRIDVSLLDDACYPPAHSTDHERHGGPCRHVSEAHTQPSEGPC